MALKATLKLKDVDVDMKNRMKRVLSRTWDAIGGDVLNNLEEMGERAVMPRADVIEVVLDAGYKDMYGDDKEAAKLIDQLSYADMKKLGRETFTYSRYGW